MGSYYMSDLFMLDKRSQAKSKVSVIKGEKYHEFMERLKDCYGIDDEFKVFLGLSLSGGLRVSEALSLRLRDIDLEKGIYSVKILKNKEAIRREVLIHPAVLPLLKNWLKWARRHYHDKLFHFTRSCVHKRVKRYFGPNACAHALSRHSDVTWLISEGYTALQIAGMLKISPKTVENYMHVNPIEEQRKLLKRAGYGEGGSHEDIGDRGRRRNQGGIRRDLERGKPPSDLFARPGGNRKNRATD